MHFIMFVEQTFHRDLSRGQVIEEKYLALIKTRHPESYRVQGYCKWWDIVVPSLITFAGDAVGVEVKSDLKSKFTGNVVVEIAFDGKDSGLRTTKAKYWIFDLGDETLVVDPDDLRNLVKMLRPVKFVGKGDVKQKEAYLVRKERIRDIALKEHPLW